jgi:hypothetical protein
MMIAFVALLVGGLLQAKPSVVQVGPPRQELQRFQKLSIRERLKVYNARYDDSGHPRDTRLAGAFDDKPGPTFDAIVADLPPGDFGRFMRYWPIIASISELRGFDACRARHFRVLEARTRSYRLDEQQLKAIGPIEFRGCTLFGCGQRKRTTS